MGKVRHLVAGLLGRLRRNRGRSDAAVPEATGPASESDSPAGQEPEFSAITEEARRALAGRVLGDSHAIHLIALGQVKAHFGERWPDVADKVHTVIAEIIQRRTGPHDLHTALRDYGYLVVYAGTKKQVAAVRCGLIAQEIAKRLFGTAESNPIQIAALERDDRDRLKGELQTADDALRKTAGQAPRTEIPVPSRVALYTPGQRRDGLKAHGGSRGASAKKVSAADGYLVVYRPMWQVRKNVLAACVCVPARMSARGKLLIGGAAMPSPTATAANASWDKVCLRRVLGDMADASARDQQIFTVAPIHIQTVADPEERRGILALCNLWAPDVRRSLAIELIGLPEAPDPEQVRDAITCLRTVCRWVFVRHRLEARAATVFRQAGARLVGIDVANLKLSEREIIAHMNRFNAEAQEAGLMTYVHGLRSISMTSSAVASGFSFVDGAPVAAHSEVPLEVSPFSISELYRDTWLKANANPPD